MLLITQAQKTQLISNGQMSAITEGGIDHKPVLKLFTPDAQCTWLLSEIDDDDHNIAFGLCDLGLGCPEKGNIYLPELEELRGQLGLPVERDRSFTADKTLTEYASIARKHGHIVA